MTQVDERSAQAPAGGADASGEPTLEELAERLDTATQKLEELDATARTVITDHLAALEALNSQALRTIVRTLKEDPQGKALLFDLVDDPAVHMVLMMNGILRPDPVTLAGQVLDGVRPGLQSHGGDVELVRIEDGTAYVRLQGACNGCSMASVTMRNGVESALVAGVPGIRGVEVLPNEPSPTLIPLSSIGVRPSDAPGLAESGWVRACGTEDVAIGALVARTLTTDTDSIDIIVVNAAGQLAAYVNACAHQGRRLDDAFVDGDAGTITCAGHGFCFDSTNGECLSMPGAQLESLPLRIESGHVWVRAEGGSS